MSDWGSEWELSEYPQLPKLFTNAKTAKKRKHKEFIVTDELLEQPVKLSKLAGKSIKQSTQQPLPAAAAVSPTETQPDSGKPTHQSKQQPKQKQQQHRDQQTRPAGATSKEADVAKDRKKQKKRQQANVVEAHMQQQKQKQHPGLQQPQEQQQQQQLSTAAEATTASQSDRRKQKKSKLVDAEVVKQQQRQQQQHNEQPHKQHQQQQQSSTPGRKEAKKLQQPPPSLAAAATTTAYEAKDSKRRKKHQHADAAEKNAQQQQQQPLDKIKGGHKHKGIAADLQKMPVAHIGGTGLLAEAGAGHAVQKSKKIRNKFKQLEFIAQQQQQQQQQAGRQFKQISTQQQQQQLSKQSDDHHQQPAQINEKKMHIPQADVGHLQIDTPLLSTAAGSAAAAADQQAGSGNGFHSKQNRHRQQDDKIVQLQQHLAAPTEEHLQQTALAAAAAAAAAKSAAAAAAVSSSAGSKLLQQYRERLTGSRFRQLNEALYTQPGGDSFQQMKEQPALFTQYHEGFQQQVKSWPTHPLDVAINWLQDKPANFIIADYGCGEARLAATVKQQVYSLDLVATVPGIIACNMALTPLGDNSVDVAVFSLALMGTDYGQFLLDAARVLKKGGWLWIAEVRSRFAGSGGAEDFTPFLAALQQLGFKVVKQDSKNKMFVVFVLKQQQRVDATAARGIQWPVLKACLYKKR